MLILAQKAAQTPVSGQLIIGLFGLAVGTVIFVLLFGKLVAVLANRYRKKVK